ncbi:hypothetical protein TWF481_003180 [Arthrobotrys musiformis]|uniref:BTB domain-containing protein n=1 Tax=Arthrobotrys musiformis TaxID=47236 RepID=A0AAV9VQQ4_9PEZI
MLDTGSFSDITVLVGHEREAFKLHRAVICSTSKFFEAACSPDYSFKETLTNQIDLPEMDPKAFRWVIRWQYEQGYNIDGPWDFGHSDLLSFRAADFLQIETLRVLILRMLAEASGDLVCSSADKDCLVPRPGKDKLDALLSNFASICECGRQGDLELLVKIAKVILPHRKVSAVEILEGLKSGAYNEIFVAAVVGAQSISPCSQCEVNQGPDIQVPPPLTRWAYLST